MKNLTKLLGIIALAAAIGFSLTGCDTGIDDITKSSLTGNVTLNNNSPKVGESITATYAPGNGSGPQTWQWFRVGTGTEDLIQNATTNTYAVTTNDEGKKIKAQLSYADRSGSLSATTTNAVAAANSGITYTVAQAGGIDGTTDSTGIVFTFSASVDSLNLSADDITIGDKATKGALTGTGTTRTLAITVTHAGQTTVQITKTGIEAGIKNVTVFKAGETAPTLTGITAVYNGTAAIYPTTPLNNLKANLTVKAQYTGGGENTLSENEYSLSGTLTVGTSTVTVSYTDGVTQTTTFDVTVTAIPIGGDGTPGLSFTLITEGANANTYSVSHGSVTSGAVVIPATYNGLPVTEIGYYAFYQINITSVTIPASVTSIGDYAFQFCPNLTSITIPEGVTSIGLAAFSGCTGITSIIILTNVMEIDFYGFSNCTSLTSVTIPASVVGKVGVFSGCTSLATLTFAEGSEIINSGWYSSLENLTTVNIPSSVTSIGSGTYDSAFSTSLTSINVDAANTTYASQDGILYNKAKTELIMAPKGISGSVIIPSSVTTIGSGAFYYCTGLTSITIPEGVTSIGEYAFGNCTSLTEITIPEGVTTIGSSAFYYCTGLTSITIPESVTTIGNSAFSNCTGLTNITIPESVTEIGDYAFYYCTGLTSITIPDGVTEIGGSAFSNCTSLTSIIIPEGVTSIGGYAFGGCTNLQNIIIDNDKLTFTSDSSLLNIFPIDNLSVTFKKNVPDYALYSRWENQRTFLTSVTILEGVTTIGYGAFVNCTGLTSITIPDSLTSIGGYVFGGCTGLTEITIPESVTSIGDSAFSSCTGLTEITIPESVTSIGNWAFSGCTSLTSITIPEGVTSIGNQAFQDWTNAQTIYVNGYASQTAADTAWGTTYWRSSCNAVIVYGVATEIVQLNRTLFLMGEQLNSLAVSVLYSNNITETVTIPAANITGFNSSTLGSKNLTVTYRGLTATFAVTVVDEMLITNTTEWNNAITQLNGANSSVTLNISGSFNVEGSTTNTFGTTSTGELTVTLKGSGTLSLSSNGNMLRVGENQTLIIDSANLILQGRSSNNASLVYVNGATAQLELRYGTISGNTNNDTRGYNSAYGGGVYVGSGGTFTMSGGTISGNKAVNNYSAGPSSNYSYGGGVSVGGATFTMNGGTISGNEASATANTATTYPYAESYGGGVYVGGATAFFTMNGGTISGNVSTAIRSNNQSTNQAYGGGVSVRNGATFRIVNGTVYGSNESNTSLRNNVTATSGPYASASGAALDGTAQRGTFSGETWNSAGSLSTTNNTIRVVNGVLQ